MADNCAYHLTMEIEFDPDKAKANPMNHEGVTFEVKRRNRCCSILMR
jgi:hypothetical protein